MIHVTTNNTGTVRFVNSSFWGPSYQIAKIAGTGTVGFGDCTFVKWDRDNQHRHAIQVSGGSVLVRGCEFHIDKPQIELGAGITGEQFARAQDACYRLNWLLEDVLD